MKLTAPVIDILALLRRTREHIEAGEADNRVKDGKTYPALFLSGMISLGMQAVPQESNRRQDAMMAAHVAFKEANRLDANQFDHSPPDLTDTTGMRTKAELLKAIDWTIWLVDASMRISTFTGDLEIKIIQWVSDLNDANFGRPAELTVSRFGYADDGPTYRIAPAKTEDIPKDGQVIVTKAGTFEVKVLAYVDTGDDLRKPRYEFPAVMDLIRADGKVIQYQAEASPTGWMNNGRKISGGTQFHKP